MKKVVVFGIITLGSLLSLALLPSKELRVSPFDKVSASYVIPDKEINEYPVISNKERITSGIVSYFQKALQKKKIVGAAIAIVKCDSIIYVDGFGDRNAKSKEKIDPETVFRIGSVSKGFGGIISGMQVENKLLTWKDSITNYIPDFTLAKQVCGKEITLSHILSHSSGVPYHSFTNLIEAGLSLPTIASQFKTVRPLAEPGEQYSYQNALFAMSGEIIEKVTCKPIQEVLENQIFQPLGMQTASATYTDLLAMENIASPHKKWYSGWKLLKIHDKYYNAVLAGGINASVTDMAKFMKFMLGNNPEVMSKNTIEQVFTPQIKVPGSYKYYQRWPGHKASFYAHGWRIHQIENEETGELSKIIHHGGHVNNFRTEIAVFPEDDLGICILFNSPTKLARTVIPDIYEIITTAAQLPEDPVLNEMAAN